MAGGTQVIPTLETDVQATVKPPTSVPTSSIPLPEKQSPSITAPSALLKSSPIHQQIEPLDVSPLSAYHDSDLGETEGKESEEKKSQGEGDESEKMPVAEPVPQEKEREEIDLNETTRKQGLMSDDEFQALLDEVNRMDVDTAEVAEGLDLPLKKQTEEEKQKSVTPQPEAGEDDKHIEEKETEVQPEEPEPVVPPVLKPKTVKRKLVLKNDSKAERPKPKRVSQRCLGRWTSSKVGANTTACVVEISSEEEKNTPTKPGDESLSATNLEDASTTTGMISPTPSDQREETDEMAEGLDLASKSVGLEEPVDDNSNIRVETRPTA
ncbi:transmembrane protein 131-like [Salvia splendens]|uniref:transmembrane protein 131-like n=1 Tax=Salvia splendens TaxID=180675 RepID=UPI001C27986B|nr:transmembrane protein 131-like [Salvia splendens]